MTTTTLTEQDESALGRAADDRAADAQTADELRAFALVERLIGSYTGAAELLTVELGRSLGLYAALFEAGAVDARTLAGRTGLDARYLREWLEQQAAAGILELVSDSVDPWAREFLLPAGHLPVLVDTESPAHVVGVATMLAGVAHTLPEVRDAFRTGKGVGFDRFGADIRHGIGAVNRPGFLLAVRDWVTAMPDIAHRLDHSGGVILDAGCGTGWSSIALARAFPLARIVGVDLDEASIREARENADAAGVGGRVTFFLGNAADPQVIRPKGHAPYTLVTVFEALHDMGRPVVALAQFRSVLDPDGAVLIADQRVGDAFQAQAGAVERLMYAMSVLHCLPATSAESREVANGTVLRAGTVRRWAATAGFRTDELPIQHEFWRFYGLR